MATVTEIAPDVFRICELAPAIDMEFNHFLVRDEKPLLFHAGYRNMFPAVYEAVKTLIDPATLGYVSFSHFESDECGALNHWLERAPGAETVCGMVGALVNLNDFAIRPVRAVGQDEAIETGRYRFRFIPTPHVPHGWDAGVLFEESQRTLFCSDLFHQFGKCAPVTEDTVMERARRALEIAESGPLASYVPYRERTGRILRALGELEPRTLAVMHGSSFRGNCAGALEELAEVMREVLGYTQCVSSSL